MLYEMSMLEHSGCCFSAVLDFRADKHRHSSLGAWQVVVWSGSESDKVHMRALTSRQTSSARVQR